LLVEWLKFLQCIIFGAYTGPKRLIDGSIPLH